MIFPIGDDNIEGGHKPIVSYTLIVLNIIAFIIQLVYGDIVVHEFASVPGSIMKGDNLITLFTSMFLHGSLMHILGNMLFLWVFADNIEAVIGSFFFIVFYIAGGLAASAVHIFTDPSSVIPTIGASGAISAVMGAYLVMFPKSRVKLIFIIFFKKFYIPAFFFLIFWFAQQLFSGFGAQQTGGGVAWWAHIGGFVFGVLIGYILKAKYKGSYEYTTTNA